MAKRTTIRCPYCGQEYLPAEIYYPDSFLGKPKDIYKDENGAILGFDGEDMNTTESFYCDKCGKPFSVNAVVTFKTTPLTDIFAEDDEFTTAIKKKKATK